MPRADFTDESAEPLEFTFHGAVFHPALSLLDLKRRKEIFGVGMDTPGGVVALLDLFEDMLGDEYEAFEALVHQHRTRPARLMEIFEWVMGQEFGPDPTRPPPGPPGPVGSFSAGPSPTGHMSSGGSPANLDLGLLGLLAQHRANSLDPERAEKLRAAVELATAELAGSPPG